MFGKKRQKFVTRENCSTCAGNVHYDDESSMNDYLSSKKHTHPSKAEWERRYVDDPTDDPTELRFREALRVNTIIVRM